jgi:hypothetical protein
MPGTSATRPVMGKLRK